MSLLDGLAPELIPWAYRLFDLAEAAGVHPRVTSGTRSHQLQETLYKKFLEGREPYLVAVPGQSAHEYGYAFDMVVPSRIDQADLGTVWVGWGGVYGGKKDPVHFEFPNWRAYASGIVPSGPDEQPSTLRSTLEAAVDQALSWLPTPLRYIVDIGRLSTSIYEWSGRSPDLLTYWLAHPQEYFDAVFSLLWSLVLAETRAQ